MTPPAAVATERRPWRGLLLPALLVFAILIGLGTWQVQRKAWKENLIATLTARLAAAPQPLPPPQAWPALERNADEYRRVTFSAVFDYSREALVWNGASAFRPDVPAAGYFVFTPARVADGGVVMVNRGFVADQNPATRAAGEIAGPVTIIGALRWPDNRHWFTPNDEPDRNLWFVRDLAAMAAAKRIGAVAPFYVEQEAPLPPGGLPQPGRLVVDLPNNHLQYAVTWYGLALVLAVVFVAWAFPRRSGR
jgi:surfeit locus 1 family protein